MTQSQHIIAKFGGQAHLARALGHKFPSKVQGWSERGIIPAHHMQAVLDKGRELGLDISVHDFFEDARE